MKSDVLLEKAFFKEIEVPANDRNWEKIYNISREFIILHGAAKKEVIDILLSMEEIFVNISHYAYPNKDGSVLINMRYLPESKEVKILFKDSGIPFDPLAKTEPDTKMPLDKRKIGGFGIYMVKKLMDSVRYKYLDGKNNLCVTKKLILEG